MTGVELARGVAKATAARSPGATHLDAVSCDPVLLADLVLLADGLRLAAGRTLSARATLGDVAVTPLGATLDLVAVPPLGATEVGAIAEALPLASVSFVDGPWRREDDPRQRLRARLSGTASGAERTAGAFARSGASAARAVDSSLGAPAARSAPDEPTASGAERTAGAFARSGASAARAVDSSLGAPAARSAPDEPPSPAILLAERVTEVLGRLVIARGWDRDQVDPSALDTTTLTTGRAGSDDVARDADRLVREFARELGATHVEVAAHGGPAGASASLATALPGVEVGPAGPGPVAVEWRVPDALGRSCVLARLQLAPRARLDLGTPAAVAALALAIGGGKLPLALAVEAVTVLPVGPTELSSARALVADLEAHGVPATLDDDGLLGARIGAAAARRVPLIAVLGPSEAAAGSVTLRVRQDLAVAWPLTLPRAELALRVAAARRATSLVDHAHSLREANGRPAHLRRPDGRDGDLTNPVWRN